MAWASAASRPAPRDGASPLVDRAESPPPGNRPDLRAPAGLIDDLDFIPVWAYSFTGAWSEHKAVRCGKMRRIRVMWDWLLPVAVLAGWVVLFRWVLPGMGVPT